MQKTIATLLMGLIFCSLLMFTPTIGKSGDLSTFGDGKVKVRFYTDYFCPPCRDMEPGIEPIIRELVQDNIIGPTFAGTPFYKHSSLYVRQFLYAMNAKKDLETALFMGRSLIEAARSAMDNEEKVQTFLKCKRISLKTFDPRLNFENLSRYLKENQIDATPSCVIETGGKKTKYVGESDTINAFNQLRKKKPNR